MLNLTTKPRITTEPRRDDYSAAFVIRWRRPWPKMTAEERVAILEAGAAYLDTIASQMREEAADI